MIVSLVLPVSTMDPSLGKGNKCSLSQQTVMEMLLEGFEYAYREEICGKPSENPSEISAWKGVTVNEEKDVVEINWSECGLEGSLLLQWLPLTVQKVSLWWNFLSGTLDLTSLPSQLIELDLEDNDFTGEIDLTKLPEKMENLSVSDNSLFGPLNLEHLPETLKTLRLSNNMFTGPLDLRSLPNGLEVLSLKNNGFTGETDFSQLPKSLTRLNISNTQLSGMIRLESDPCVGTSDVNLTVWNE